MSLEEFHEILGNLDFVKRYKYYIVQADTNKYKILGTTFEIHFFNGKFYFVDRSSASDFHWTFEQILPRLPEEIAIKFLFHLDKFI